MLTYHETFTYPLGQGGPWAWSCTCSHESDAYPDRATARQAAADHQADEQP